MKKKTCKLPHFFQQLAASGCPLLLKDDAFLEQEAEKCRHSDPSLVARVALLSEAGTFALLRGAKSSNYKVRDDVLNTVLDSLNHTGKREKKRLLVTLEDYLLAINYFSIPELKRRQRKVILCEIASYLLTLLLGLCIHFFICFLIAPELLPTIHLKGAGNSRLAQADITLQGFSVENVSIHDLEGDYIRSLNDANDWGRTAWLYTWDEASGKSISVQYENEHFPHCVFVHHEETESSRSVYYTPDGMPLYLLEWEDDTFPRYKRVIIYNANGTVSSVQYNCNLSEVNFPEEEIK